MKPASTLPVEAVPGHPDFRPLAGVRGIDHDLRYAGTDNFAGQVLYRGFDCAWLRAEAAAGLETAAGWLQARHPGWRLRVLDALRPQRVQEAIWADVVGTPMAMYFADPARGSIHSFGMAVDVTLLDPEGREVDMGSGFDEMSLASHPALHAEHLASGVLTPGQVALRERLAAAMAAGGFAGIPTEWWHFDHGDRDAVRRTLPRVD
jgi:zinc D-Ala-D-Ala dipeptidase